MSRRLDLRADGVTAHVDLDNGGRLASLCLGGDEVLVTAEDDALQWGCYPMVPFAGRIRRGLLDFEGSRYELPTNLGPHAIHGYGFTSPWTQIAPDTIEWTFGPPWPFRGSARQRFVLRPGSLRIEMTVSALDRQPVSFGWHPWFRRLVGGETLDLSFTAASMYELDGESIPTGDLVPPPNGPWDNCFTGLTDGPRLRWGGRQLDLSATTDHWVVYDEPEHAACVEPQTGPPNESNRSPRVLEPSESTRLLFDIEWRNTP